MIVCSCHAVSDARLRELAQAGASEHDVAHLTGAGTSCGCCAEAVKALLSTERPPCGKQVPCPGCACAAPERRAKAA